MPEGSSRSEECQTLQGTCLGQGALRGSPAICSHDPRTHARATWHFMKLCASSDTRTRDRGPGADGSGRCRGPGRARGPDTRPSRSPPQTFRPPRTARGGPEACSRFRPASRRQYEDITASIPERTRVLGSFITAAPGGDAITGVGGCPRPPLRAGRRPRAPSRRGREGAAGRRAARRHALGCTGVKGEGTGMAGGARARARGTDRLPGSPLHGAGRSCLCLQNLLVVPRSRRSGGSGDRAPPPGSRPGDTSQSRGCSRPRGLPQETRGSCRFAANAQVLEPE